MTPNQAALSLANALETPGADFDALVAATELRRLVAENEALRADAELLDWMQRQSLDDFAVGLVVDAPHDGEYWCSPDTGGMYYGKTLREALKAARKG